MTLQMPPQRSRRGPRRPTALQPPPSNSGLAAAFSRHRRTSGGLWGTGRYVVVGGFPGKSSPCSMVTTSAVRDSEWKRW